MYLYSNIVKNMHSVTQTCDKVKFKREVFLSIKSKFLEKGIQIKPNSRLYKRILQIINAYFNLTPYQKYCIIGLLLGDGSVEYTRSGLWRFKMQQTIRHKEFMNHLVQEVFPEYTFQLDAGKVSEKRSDMVYFQTNVLGMHIGAPLHTFYKKAESVGNMHKNVKTIPLDIIKYLHPIVIAYWFACDGGKSDYHGHSKALAFHTQGFSTECVNLLVAALQQRYGWTVAAVKQGKTEDQWWIRISDYDDFMEKVGPFIHPTMVYKLPTFRRDVSRFGHMNQSLFESTISSFYKEKACQYISNDNLAFLVDYPLEDPLEYLNYWYNIID